VDPGWYRELLGLGSTPPIPAPARLALPLILLVRVVLSDLGGLTARELRSSLVANRYEERRYVLAVLAGFLEGRAGTVRRDALAPEADRRLVRFRIGTLHAAFRNGIVDFDVFDDASLLVVQPP
jgi:hypothetical protein